MPKNLDLLLVNVGGTKRNVYQDLSKDYSAIDTPFWAALTAGFIRNNGFNVEVLDASAENLDNKETVEKINYLNPKFTGIVVYGQQAATCSPLMDGVGKLCREIKSSDKQKKIILTGWHPSSLPERTIREEDCDFVGQGEGFLTYLGLLKGEDLEKIQGLWWREGKNIRNNPRPKNIENLTSELNDVAWDLLPMKKYRAHDWACYRDLDSKNRYASIYTSLGCPFNCKFCGIHETFGERKVRNWSPEWVLNQVDILVKEHDVKNIKIIDEMYLLNPKHYMPIAEGLIQRDYGLNIWAFARVDTIKEEYLDKLKHAGFNSFCLGIESGNKEILKNMSKGTYGKDGIRATVKKIEDHGIDISANYMFGLPNDNFDTMQDTLNLAVELNCVCSFFSATMANPGSELYSECIKEGIKLPDSWLGYAQQGYEFLPLPTETLSAEEVLRFRDYAWDTYYRNPRYLRMIEDKFGLRVRKHIEDMTKFKIKRKILGD